MWQEMEEEGVLDYETVLVLVAAWSQPEADISVTSMTSELDSLASRVLAHLHTVQPKHKIFEAVRLEQEAREEANVDWGQIPSMEKVQSENLWSSQESKDIFSATNHIFYSVDGFAGNKEDYYNPNNSFINKVLDSKQVKCKYTISHITICIAGHSHHSEPPVHVCGGQARRGLSPCQLPRSLHAQVAGAPRAAGAQAQVHFHRRLRPRQADDRARGPGHGAAPCGPGRELRSGRAHGGGPADAEEPDLHRIVS